VKFGNLFRRGKDNPEPSGVGKPGQNDAGRQLRLRVLSTPPDDLGIKPTEAYPRTYAALVDFPISDQIATIFSAGDGAASLYTTSAFGIVGGERHEPVRLAAQSFVSLADGFFDRSEPTSDFGYPSPSQARFYFLTFEGVRKLDATMAEVSARGSAYFELFDKAQAVLTQLRTVVDGQGR